MANPTFQPQKTLSTHPLKAKDTSVEVSSTARAVCNNWEVVEVARSLLNTPYQHQGRKPQIGVDCIGVIMVTAHTLDLFQFDFNNYSRDADGTLETEVKKHCEPLPKLELGALALFKISALPHHCGIITRYRKGWGLLHAYQNVGRVKEHELIDWWQNRLVGLYALPNVKYG